MKTAAIIDEGINSERFYTEYLRKIRIETCAEAIIVIMNGPFLHCGLPAFEEKHSRAEKLMRAGADAVVELPVSAVLLGLHAYTAALSTLLRRLGCVEELILPVEQGNLSLFETVCSLLLRMPPEYQAALKRQKMDSNRRNEWVPAAVEQVLPGGGTLLCQPMNRFAVELCNQMRLSYCPVKVHLLEADWTEAESVISPKTDARLGEILSARLTESDQADLTNIFGGYERLAEKLLTLSAQTFTQYAKALSSPQESEEEIRHFLLRFLLNFRKIDHGVSALQSHVPMIRVIDIQNAMLSEQLEQCAQAPVIWSLPQGNKTSGGATLLEFDERAAVLENHLNE